MLSGAELTAERIAAEVGGAGRRDRRRPRREAEARVVYELRYAGQAFELPVPGPVEPDPAELRRALRARPRGALRPPRPRRRGRPRRHRPRAGRPRPGAASRSRRGEGALERSSRRVRFDGEWVETPVLRGEPAGRQRGRGPGRLRAPRGDLRPPARLARRGRRARHDRRAVPSRIDAKGTTDERAGPDRAAGPGRRPARRLRRDGRDADPLGLLGQHQGAPRLLDRALRRRRRAGDAGRAHPRPPRLDARRGRRRARRGAAARATTGSSTTPTAAAPTCPTSPSISPVFAGGELLGFAASRAHHADVGGPTPGSDARLLADARRRGRGDPADAWPTTATLERLAAQMRDAAPAPRRPARPAGGEPDRRAAPRRAARAARRRGAARGDGRDPRLHRAPHPRRPRRAPRRHLPRPRTCSRPTGTASERDLRLRARGDDRRRLAAARLQRQRGAGRRATSTARSR